MMEQMSLTRIAQISDPFLRTTLITAAENIEKLMKTGKIGPATKLKSPTPHGLTIDIFVELKGDEKPDVYTLTYSLDQAALKQYLILNKNLCEGPLSFVSKGIEITIPKGPDKLDKSGFSFDDNEGNRIWLPLWDKPCVFRVHRNLFGGKEWECYYDEQQ